VAPSSARPDRALGANFVAAAIAPRAVGLLLLTVGGAVTIALETVYVHLLAVVAGNSAMPSR